jgi:hypothetical protein
MLSWTRRGGLGDSGLSYESYIQPLRSVDRTDDHIPGVPMGIRFSGPIPFIGWAGMCRRFAVLLFPIMNISPASSPKQALDRTSAGHRGCSR